MYSATDESTVLIFHAPIDCIYFFCLIIRLGSPFLSAHPNPELRAINHTVLVRSYGHYAPAGSFRFAQARNHLCMPGDKSCIHEYKNDNFR